MKNNEPNLETTMTMTMTKTQKFASALKNTTWIDSREHAFWNIANVCLMAAIAPVVFVMIFTGFCK